MDIIIIKKNIFFKTIYSNKKLFLELLGLYTLLKLGYGKLKLGKYYAFYFLKKIPMVKNEIDKKVIEVRNGIKTDLNQPFKNFKLNLNIPKIGNKEIEIIENINKLMAIKPFNLNDGRVSGCVYSNSVQLNNLMTQIFPIIERTNPLHPHVFPGIRKMEAEIVNMCGNLLKSPNPEVGCFTSGGTESILLAMRCFKKIAINKGYKGEIVLSKGAHAAYWKAAEYFDMNIIEIETLDKPLDINALKSHITVNSTVVIASAPSYNFGIVDNIKAITDYCYNNNIYVHVDMCLGGFLVPFLTDIECDFTLPGLTSISMDTHKYGYGPKGGSVLLYRDKMFLKNHCFVKDDWTGGIYGTSNLTGSRSGSVVGLTWATMLCVGLVGYEQEAIKIRRLTLKLANAIKINQYLDLMGTPSVCIVAISSKKFNIYLLSDKMKGSGWSVGVLQKPASFHLCITSIHTEEIINQFINDINKFSCEIIGNKDNKKEQPVCIYGTTQKVDDTEIISDMVKEYICCLSELE